MKKKNTNGEEKKSRISKKRFFLNSAMYLALFGVAAATTYLSVPRPAIGRCNTAVQYAALYGVLRLLRYCNRCSAYPWL